MHCSRDLEKSICEADDLMPKQNESGTHQEKTQEKKNSKGRKDKGNTWLLFSEKLSYLYSSTYSLFMSPSQLVEIIKMD